MTPTAAALILDRALRQVDNGHCATHITAAQLAELAACYLCLRERMSQVEQLADGALLAWCDHHRDVEHDKLSGILDLTNSDICDTINSV